jgi:hypothetical protein
VNAGESHWLVDRRRRRSSGELPTTADGFEQCMSCGPDCPIVTDDLRHRLADPDAEFYATLAAAYRSDIIVTSDKSLKHVLKLDPSLCNDTIVLFRHPVMNWRSHCGRHPAFASPQGQHRYFDRWADDYTVLLRYYHNEGLKLVVNFDHFAVAPSHTLAMLCGRLSLAFDPGALDYWRRRQHFVGGNIRLGMRLRSASEDTLKIGAARVAPSDRPEPESTPELARALGVWAELDASHACWAGES